MAGRHAATPKLSSGRVLLASLAVAAVAAAAFFLLRQRMLDRSADEAVTLARAALETASRNLPADPSRAELRRALDVLADPAYDVVLDGPGGEDVASRFVDADAVPEGLASLVGAKKLAYDRTTVRGTHYVVVGGRTGSTNVYLFVPEDDVRAGVLRQGIGLGLGWVVVTALLLLAALGTLQARVRALSETRARERRFTADVAHELRTPLTALVGEASLLAEQVDRLPPEARRPAEMLVTDLARLRRLVDDLLEISRLDAGAEPVEVGPVDVDALLRGIVRSRAWDSSVVVEARGVHAQTDRRRLERIVSNLVGNAVEHGGAGVTAAARRDGDSLVVTVTDTGPGIPPGFIDRVFDRFSKADPSRAGRGSGLGLAIALENARLLGGDIEVESEPGRGTTFTLRVPGEGP